MDPDIYEIPGLLCTRCGHDLNHELYTVCQHPLFPVPLCILCFEDIQESYEQYIGDNQVFGEELCHWCWNEAETALFLCDCQTCPLTKKQCEFQFCSRCIEDNLGRETLQKIQKSETWHCFVCEPSQLRMYEEAIVKGREISKLEDLTQLNNNNTNSASNAEPDLEVTAEKMEHASWILTSIVKQIEESLKMIDPTVISEKENEVRKEFLGKGVTESVTELSRNEIELYCKYWQRHIDILQREEAIYFEMIESYGYDPRDLEVYQLDVSAMEKELTFAEKQALLAAEAKLQELDIVRKQKPMDHENTSVSSVIVNTKKSPADFVYEERVIEELDPEKQAQYEKLLSLAETNPIIMKYQQHEKVDPDLYPSSFEHIVPVNILQALFYASRKERKELDQIFDIPVYVSIIMSLADNEFPLSTLEWSFATTVHPSVLKALYFTRSSIELAVLCQHYQLDPSICGVTDFGEAKEVYQLLKKEKSRKQDPNEKKLQFTERDVLDALEVEQGSYEEEMKDYEAREARAMIRSPSSRKASASSSSNTRLQQTNLKSFFQIKCTTEEHDEEKVRRERRDDVRSKMKSQVRTNRKVSKMPSSEVPTSTTSHNTASEEKKQQSPLLANDAIPRLPLLSVPKSKVFTETVDLTSPTEAPLDLSNSRNKSKNRPPTPFAVAKDIATSSSSPQSIQVTEAALRSPEPVETPVETLYWMEESPETTKKYAQRELVDLSMMTEEEDDLVSESDDTLASLEDSDVEIIAENGIPAKKRPLKGSQKPVKKAQASKSSSRIDAIEFDSDGEVVEATNRPALTKKLSKLSKNGSNDSNVRRSIKVITTGGRGNIANFFSQETKDAKKAERARRKALESFNYYQDDENAITLNTTRPVDEPSINVSSNFIKALKPHQIDGLRFLWTNVIGSLSDTKKISKSTNGCVLAHCMGLGKTFTIISFVVTLLTHPKIKEIEDPRDRKTKEKERDQSKKEKEVASLSKEKENNQAENTPIAHPPSTRVDSSLPSGGTNTTSNATPSMSETPLEVKRLIFRVLIVVPKNTLQNWVDEFKRWTPEDLLEQFNLLLINSTNQKTDRQRRKQLLQLWFEEGGVLIIGYEMFRNLLTVPAVPNMNSKKNQTNTNTNSTTPNNTADTNNNLTGDYELYRKYLLSPGADLVIADEAHTIKNARSKLSQLLDQVKTRRRIALTGSPLQNNLEEYWVMVHWVKPYFLYSIDEYRRIFVHPIQHGSSKDASLAQIHQMKKRSHALYHKLTPVVHRRDNIELTNSLLPKREFILSIQMTELQKFYYKYYLSQLPSNGRTLFKAYQCLMRIWNHPCCLIYHLLEQTVRSEKNQKKEKDLTEEIGRPRGRPVGSTSSNNNSFNDLFTKRSTNKAKLSVRDFREELQQSYAYFLYCRNSKQTMSEIEAAAKNQEDRLLIGKEQQSKELLRAAEEFGSLEDQNEPNSPLASDKRKKKQSKKKKNRKSRESPISDDYDEEDFEEEEEDDDLDGFVVDDDVIEYEEDASTRSASEDNSDEEDEDVWVPSDEDSRNDYDDDEDDATYDNDDNDEALEVKKKKRKRAKPRKSPPSLKKQKTEFSEAQPDHETPLVTTSSFTPMEVADPMGKKPEDQPNGIVGVMTESCKSTGDGNTSSNNPAITNESPVNNEAIDTLVEEEAPEILDHNWWKFEKQVKEIPHFSSLFLSKAHLSNTELLQISNKMIVLFGLLACSVKAGDKMLVFSQSLSTLSVIEAFLRMPHWGSCSGAVSEEESEQYHLSRWQLFQEYLRIDGSISNRQKLINDFNSQRKYRLLLISTKAGNMGINLQSANRVVIFDSSWNPVHDLQAIFRTYRFGQEKNVFVYRLYAAGSMEEKIYKNQVVKQSLSERVVDKKMPENHFTEQERAEYLAFVDNDDEEEGLEKDNDLNSSSASSLKKGTAEGEMIDKETIPTLSRDEQRKQKLMDLINSGTKDTVLLELISRIGTSVFKSVEDHDSLLADQVEQHLNEEEQKAAIEEIEKEQEILARGSSQSQVNRVMVAGAGSATNSNTPLLDNAIAALSNRGNSLFSSSLPPVNPQQQMPRSVQSQVVEALFLNYIFNLLLPMNPNASSILRVVPPQPIPTNIAGWKSNYDMLLVALTDVFPTDSNLVVVSALVNQYVTKCGGISYDISLYQRRLNDMKTNPRPYYREYIQHLFIRGMIFQLRQKLIQLYRAHSQEIVPK